MSRSGFESIIDKLQSVGLDPAGRKAQVLKGAKSLDSRFEAGAEVLDKYQIQWAQMQETTEVNAAKATAVSQTIDKISNSLSQKDAIVNEFELLISSIDFLGDGIKILEKDLECALVLIRNLEELLLKRKRVIANEKLKRQFDSQYLLKIYQEKRNREFERSCGDLKSQHLTKIQDMRRKEEQRLQERQQAFKAAFEDQLNKYKLEGKIEKPTIDATASSSTLDDVVVELDQSDEESLHRFLADD